MWLQMAQFLQIQQLLGVTPIVRLQQLYVLLFYQLHFSLRQSTKFSGLYTSGRRKLDKYGDVQWMQYHFLSE
jgi:hypothetical protein